MVAIKMFYCCSDCSLLKWNAFSMWPKNNGYIWSGTTGVVSFERHTHCLYLSLSILMRRLCWHFNIYERWNDIHFSHHRKLPIFNHFILFRRRIDSFAEMPLSTCPPDSKRKLNWRTWAKGFIANKIPSNGFNLH